MKNIFTVIIKTDTFLQNLYFSSQHAPKIGEVMSLSSSESVEVQPAKVVAKSTCFKGHKINSFGGYMLNYNDPADWGNGNRHLLERDE